jgi:predicted XRE-type DNA-binding protein
VKRKKTLAERFWPNVLLADGCWTWTAYKSSGGYGRLTHLGRCHWAHRVSYELNVGPIEGGLHVLHRCDNPACVRPEHLSLGTRTDNMQDALKKGRLSLGERHSSKLTKRQVERIKVHYETWGTPQRILAKEYGISQQQVSNIVRGKTWRYAIAH